jgi:hypothetical protein
LPTPCPLLLSPPLYSVSLTRMYRQDLGHAGHDDLGLGGHDRASHPPPLRASSASSSPLPPPLRGGGCSYCGYCGYCGFELRGGPAAASLCPSPSLGRARNGLASRHRLLPPLRHRCNWNHGSRHGLARVACTRSGVCCMSYLHIRGLVYAV